MLIVVIMKIYKLMQISFNIICSVSLRKFYLYICGSTITYKYSSYLGEAKLAFSFKTVDFQISYFIFWDTLLHIYTDLSDLKLYCLGISLIASLDN